MIGAARGAWPAIAAWLGLALIALVYGGWTWSGELAGLGGDNAIYLLTARHFSPWEGASTVARFFAVHNDYPPLYPALIGALGGASDPRIAHLVTAMTLVLALVAYGRWLARVGAPASVAVVLPLACAAMPGTYLQAVHVHSEGLYLLLSLCALYVIARVGHASAPATDRNLLALAWLWLALALLTRTAGIALLIAAAVHLLRPRGVLASTVLASALLPALIWRWIGGQVRGGYVADWLERAEHLSLAESPERVLALARMVSDAWRQHLFGSVPGLGVAAGVLLLIAVGGCVWRARRGHVDGLYGVVYGVMLLGWGYVWPSEVSRLLFPVVPLLLFHVHWLLDTATGHALSAPRRAGVQGALLAVWIVGLTPYTVHAIERFAAPLPAGLEPYRRSGLWYERDPVLARSLLERHATVVEALREVSALVPDGECVYAAKPSIVGYYAGRRSVDPPGERESDEAFWRRIRGGGGCGYVIGFNWRTPTFPTPFYPLPRLGSHAEVRRVWSSRDDAEVLVVLAALPRR